MKKALLVGINEYDNGNNLNYCVKDINSIKKLLEYNGDETKNFDISTIEGYCTSNKLKESLKNLFQDDSEIALFYFSGHGHDYNGGYICTSDSQQIGIEMSEIINLANNSKSKNKIIILDCCFAAKLGEIEQLQNCTLIAKGVTVISASETWQFAAEDGKEQHGIFTSLLIKGLEGGAADLNGNITPAGLYSYIDKSLGAWDQRPVFKTNISQFLSIRKVPAKVPISLFRKICELFEFPDSHYKLNPSYEFTNALNYKHEIKEPFAIAKNIEVFKELQLLESVGLIEPVGEKHMYFAAMNNKACKLTELGKHYWNLSKNKRI